MSPELTRASAAVICRVCMQNVKKSAVLCSQCSLIAHSKCAGNAPPTCDLRSQLLLYAQFAERGSPVDFLAAARGSAAGPASDGALGAGSSRASFDTAQNGPSSQASVPHPPTAYKLLSPLKRSMASLSPEPARSSSAMAGPSTKAAPHHHPHREEKENVIRRKLSVLVRPKEPKERPLSVSSDSTAPHTASMRSMATTRESYSSRRRGNARSGASVADADAARHLSAGSRAGEEAQRVSKMSLYSGASTVPERDADDEAPSTAHMPGDMPDHDARRSRRSRDAKGNSGCTVQ